MQWQLCCCGAKKPLNWDVTGLELVSSGPSPWKSGTAQVNRCGLLAFRRASCFIQATHKRRRLIPGFGPVAWGRSLSSSPQKPLSLAAMPYSSTLYSFSHPSLLFQIIFVILHLCKLHFSSIMFFSFLSQIFFITHIKTSQLSVLPPPTSHPHPSLSYPPQGCPFVSLQPSSYLSVEVQSPVAAALECQTVIY